MSSNSKQNALKPSIFSLHNYGTNHSLNVSKIQTRVSFWYGKIVFTILRPYLKWPQKQRSNGITFQQSPLEENLKLQPTQYSDVSTNICDEKYNYGVFFYFYYLSVKLSRVVK